MLNKKTKYGEKSFKWGSKIALGVLYYIPNLSYALISSGIAFVNIVNDYNHKQINNHGFNQTFDQFNNLTINQTALKNDDSFNSNQIISYIGYGIVAIQALRISYASYSERKKINKYINQYSEFKDQTNNKDGLFCETEEYLNQNLGQYLLLKFNINSEEAKNLIKSKKDNLVKNKKNPNFSKQIELLERFLIKIENQNFSPNQIDSFEQQLKFYIDECGRRKVSLLFESQTSGVLKLFSDSFNNVVSPALINGGFSMEKMIKILTYSGFFEEYVSLFFDESLRKIQIYEVLSKNKIIALKSRDMSFGDFLEKILNCENFFDSKKDLESKKIKHFSLFGMKIPYPISIPNSRDFYIGTTIASTLLLALMNDRIIESIIITKTLMIASGLNTTKFDSQIKELNLTIDDLKLRKKEKVKQNPALYLIAINIITLVPGVRLFGAIAEGFQKNNFHKIAYVLILTGVVRNGAGMIINLCQQESVIKKIDYDWKNLERDLCAIYNHEFEENNENEFCELERREENLNSSKDSPCSLFQICFKGKANYQGVSLEV